VLHKAKRLKSENRFNSGLLEWVLTPSDEKVFDTVKTGAALSSGFESLAFFRRRWRGL
jgi:hypothetical protein